MTTQEQLKIFAAYLPYGLELQIEDETETEYTMFLGEMDSIMPGKAVLAGITKETSFMPECLLFTRNDGEPDGYIQPKNAKPILYDLSFLTKEIEHDGKKFQVIKEILNQASVYDLTDCIFEINEDDENVYIDAYKHGRLIDALHYDGNLFIMNRDDKYHPPQLELHDILLKYHFNVFGIPAGDFIDKATLKTKSND